MCILATYKKDVGILAKVMGKNLQFPKPFIIIQNIWNMVLDSSTAHGKWSRR